MKSLKIVGILLLVGAISLGYVGYSQFEDSNRQVEVFDETLDFSNEEKKSESIIYLSIAGLLFVGGIYVLTRK